jgi:hypothetical protein
MEQRTAGTLNTNRSDHPSGDPADPLANVWCLADCLEEWAVLHRRAVPVPPVVVESQTEAGHPFTTIHPEPQPC